MPTIRDTLNKIKWASPEGLQGIEVVIIHRGAPENKKVIKGEEIKDIAPRAMVCEDVIIPYHRVLCIRRGAKIIWSRGSP
ncbi:MAG: DUF504 domain-containing protein [Candidatus Methanomethylicaceae archaeon]